MHPTTTAAPPEETEVQAMLRCYRQQVDELQGVVCELASRLEPVLRPVPRAIHDAPVDGSELCALASTLLCSNRSLSVEVAKIRELLGLLEI